MPVRHTPGPARVAYAVGGAFLLGVLTALPGALHSLWFLSLTIETMVAGYCFMALSLGVLFGMVLWRRLGSGLGVRGSFVCSGLLASASLVALSLVNTGRSLPAPLFGLGLAIGTLAVGMAWLLSAILPPTSARAVLQLAGAAFGAGALGVCLLAWGASDLTHWGILVRTVATAPLFLTVLALRADVFRHLTLNAPSWNGLGSHFPVPMAVLLGLALAAQAATLWAMGGWLTVYLSRKLGVTLGAGLLMLALFWAAFTSGSVLAGRLSTLEERMRILLWCTLAGAAGCVFLLKTVDLSGAVMGVILLATGLGVVHPLTLGIAARRIPKADPRLLSGLLALLLVTGLLAPGAVGLLAKRFAIDVLIWFSLAGLSAGFLLLAGVFVELKLTAPSAAVRL